MKLPTELKHTLHRHGGRILQISRCAHETAKPSGGRSQDFWFFVGDVEWPDGERSNNVEIAPWALVYDGDEKEEVHALSKLMNDYLLEHGKFYEDGKHKGWYATKR